MIKWYWVNCATKMVDEQTGSSQEVDISLQLNGVPKTDTVEPRRKLSDYLRYDQNTRSVKTGCEHGVCGACVVSVDGRNVKSCLMYAVEADGAEIETAEGLSEDGELHPIQAAFHEEHALQCGYCTGGLVMATQELLEDNPDPSEEEIKAGLADNICRCTGYQPIFDAVKRAAKELSEE